MTVLDILVQRIRDLPGDKQQEVLDFVEFLHQQEDQRQPSLAAPSSESSAAEEVVEADYWGVLGSGEVE